MLYNVVLVAAVEQPESAVRVHTRPTAAGPRRAPGQLPSSAAAPHQLSALLLRVCVNAPSSAHPTLSSSAVSTAPVSQQRGQEFWSAWSKLPDSLSPFS